MKTETNFHFRTPTIEPKASNRFIIKPIGVEIDPYLFRKYKLYNEGENIIFTTEFFETVNFTFNPKDFFNITGFMIHQLDPIGVVLNTLSFNVKGSNFLTKNSYKSNKFLTHKMRFIVNVDSIKIIEEITSEVHKKND